jgi:hypothetical protein
LSGSTNFKPRERLRRFTLLGKKKPASLSGAKQIELLRSQERIEAPGDWA